MYLDFSYMIEEEGPKFDLDFTKGPPIEYDEIKEIFLSRGRLYERNLIGEDREDTFGNLAMRISNGEPVHERMYVVSGTKTSGIPTKDLNERHFSIVEKCYPERNYMKAGGPVRPSREALSHGVLFDCDEEVRGSVHSHNSVLWNYAEILGIPSTDKRYPYGTREIAIDMRKIYSMVKKMGILKMGGHKDGMISIGSSIEEATSKMIYFWEEALKLLKAG